VQESIYTYQLGSIKLTIISEGTLKVTAKWMFDGVDEAQWRPLVAVDEAGRQTYGMNIVHVAIAGHSILLDTGIGEPHPSRKSLESSFPMTQTASLIPCLASIGVQPEQVTAVIFSHTHFDHILGATVERNGQRVPAFPNARYLLRREEWEKAPGRSQPDSPFHLHFAVLQEHNLLDLIEGEYEVAPGIRMIPSPGETPGHASIKMESQGKTAFYVGDLFHDPAEVLHLDWAPRNRDKARLLASREALVREALATDAVLITAHMPFPGMGKLRRLQDMLEWVAMLPVS
jgi:glyoxylase-like metal-dependent hydrolase (beta-lactamase superfamily II)